MTKPITFELLFGWYPDDKLSPLYATARIALRDPIFHAANFPGHEDDITLTCDCASFREVEVQVDRLHRELDQVLNIARQKFSERDAFRKSLATH